MMVPNRAEICSRLTGFLVPTRCVGMPVCTALRCGLLRKPESILLHDFQTSARIYSYIYKTQNFAELENGEKILSSTGINEIKGLAQHYKPIPVGISSIPVLNGIDIYLGISCSMHLKNLHTITTLNSFILK
jgi:hypothetical protein